MIHPAAVVYIATWLVMEKHSKENARRKVTILDATSAIACVEDWAIHVPPHEHGVWQTVDDGERLEAERLVLPRLEEAMGLICGFLGLDAVLSNE